MNQGQAIAQSVFDGTWGGASLSIAKVGQLNPDQANTFIDYIFDQSVLTKVARVVRMKAPQARIGKVDMGNKPLRPATRGVDPGVTQQASVSEINLVTKELIAEAQILDDELEDNTEQGDFADHFMRLLGIKIGNQLELAYLMGNNVGIGGAGPAAVDINQLFGGWNYQISANGGHVVDGGLANPVYSDRYLSTDKLNKLIKVIPPKYRTQAMNYRFIVSPNAYQDFLNLVGNRATPFGDQAWQAQGYEQNLPTQSVLGWGRIPLYVAPLLPESQFVAITGGGAAASTLSASAAAGAATVVLTSATGFSVGDSVSIDTGGLNEVFPIASISTNTLTLGTNADGHSTLQYPHNSAVAAVRGVVDGTFVALTHFQNFIVGIQRDIRIELDRRPRERATYAVVTLRVDCQMENPDAAGLLKNLAIRP